MALSIKTRILDSFRLINQIPLIERWLVNQSLNNNRFARKMIGGQYLYKTDTLRRCTRNGIHYELHINDYLDHGIYFGLQEHVDFNRDSLLKHASKGDVIVDIGANIGDTTLRLAQVLNNNGFVYAFEPSPHVFKRLQTNVGLNGFTNISLYNMAVGDEEGELSFVSTKQQHTGGAYVSKVAKTDTSVKVITLDDFVEQNNITQINLIKIDTEGFEDFVVRGAEKTLRKFKPKIFMEVSDILLQRAGTSAKQLVALMQALNYRCFHSETGEEITPEYNFSDMHFDVICEIN